MKVGTVVKLKVACLDNKAGTLGVVFYNYTTGFQAIFENGNLDGFSTLRQSAEFSEADRFLEEIGYQTTLAAYPFRSVSQVYADYRKGFFDIAWSEGWKLKAALRIEQGATEEKHPTQALKGLAEAWRQSNEADEKSEAEPEYEKCEVYADGNKRPWLRFKRKHLDDDGVTCCMLSAAKDYADFSHFEYADGTIRLEPRWSEDGVITIFPLYVLFRKIRK